MSNTMRNALLAAMIVIIVGGVFYFFTSGSEMQPSPAAQQAQQPQPTQQAAAGNLLWPSEDFTSPTWKRTQTTIQPAAGAAPDGKNTGSRLVETSDTGRHFTYAALHGMAAGTYTFSVFVKAAERSGAFLEVRDSTPKKYGNATCSFPDAAGGSIAKTGDITDAGVEKVANGWYRCWVAMPYSLPDVFLGVELRDANGALDYKGDGHSGLLIWGAQFEAGGKPTAYVPTATGPEAKPK